MAHISELNLKELAKPGMLKGNQVAGLDKCESCIYGKATKVKFNKTTIYSSKIPLESIAIYGDLPRLSLMVELSIFCP